MTSAIRTEDFLSWLADYLGSIGHRPAAPLDLQANFADLGLDSMDVVILAAAFEDRFGLPIDPAFFMRISNLGGLLGELRARAVLA